MKHAPRWYVVGVKGLAVLFILAFCLGVWFFIIRALI